MARQSQYIHSTGQRLSVEDSLLISCSHAVTGFAKATGEVHSLSSADIRLIALAYMLHVERYGKQSLRLEAAPARPAGKGKKASQALPGWGAAGGEWAELDKLNQDELDAQEGIPLYNSACTRASLHLSLIV